MRLQKINTCGCCLQDVQEKKRNKKKDKKKRKGKKGDEKEDANGDPSGGPEEPEHAISSPADDSDAAASKPPSDAEEAASHSPAPAEAAPETQSSSSADKAEGVQQNGKRAPGKAEGGAGKQQAAAAVIKVDGSKALKPSPSKIAAGEKQQTAASKAHDDQADADASEWQSVAPAARKARRGPAAKSAASRPDPAPAPQQKPAATAHLSKPQAKAASQAQVEHVQPQPPAPTPKKAAAKGKNSVLPADVHGAGAGHAKQQQAAAPARHPSATFADIARPPGRIADPIAKQKTAAGPAPAAQKADAAAGMPGKPASAAAGAAGYSKQAEALPAQTPASVKANGERPVSSSPDPRGGQATSKAVPMQMPLKLDTPVAARAVQGGQAPVGKAVGKNKPVHYDDAALGSSPPLRVGPQACSSHAAALSASAASWTPPMRAQPNGMPLQQPGEWCGSLPQAAATPPDAHPKYSALESKGSAIEAASPGLAKHADVAGREAQECMASQPISAAPGWHSCLGVQSIDWSFPRTASGTSLSSAVPMKPKVSCQT